MAWQSPRHATLRTVQRILAWAVVFLLAACSTYGGEPPSTALRGHLRQEKGKSPVIETADHKFVALDGDDPTMAIMNDARLKDADVEVLGHPGVQGHFEIHQIFLPSVFVYKDGKRLQVSYWCDVCYIRTSSPGKCWCCQKYTDLDLIEPEQ